ncbi:MAG TPA: DNA polymerase III subunit alpha [Desulfocapsa sulfexigens]|nr:DNA polymerase III subunit alpha [Desulfocapsa sulfexigens]
MFPLAVRSYYSLMRGSSSPASLCARAQKLGYTGLALTDYNSMAGLWPFLAACKKYGLRALVGAEISDPHSPATVICLVNHSIGYTNLCNLISRRKINEKFSLQREVIEHNAGLIFLIPSISLLHNLRKYNIELAADLGSRPTERSGKLRKWARANSVPAVATPGAVMAQQSEKDLFQLMQAIRTNSRLDEQQEENDDFPACLESPVIYQDRFAVWPEVLAATDTLAARCTFSGPDFGIVMPPWAGNEFGAADSLRKAAYRGACHRYGTDLSEAVVERLEHELRVIDSMGFSSYFLVVRDIVHQACIKADGGTTRICGRGSGAASLVAYCLEITNVCPVKHNLYFERFLNPGRSDPPDIDIDFSWDERDAILANVLKNHGRHAAMVSTIIRFQPRMAIRETAKAFGLPPGEVSRMSKRLGGIRGRSSEPLLSSLQKMPALKKEELADPWPEIVRLASGLIGIPRHMSVHPGGVIITPDPVSNYVPVEFAAKGVPIIQWDKDGAEEAGLVKIDLLGNRSLGVIRDCIASIENSGRCFDEEYWQPDEDLQTRQAVAAGKTMGCFYIESPAMRLLQKRAGSGDFEQLVLQSSIIRPAANEFVREYVRRLHGGHWQHLHPRLADVLDDTFGLMVYQEDVSRVAVALAGFSHARADGLRKVMSKKDKELRLKDYYREFDKGCAAKGVDEETREKLWQMMMSFDGYSFCKPHSASYARVSYQAAYLKTHFPAEFMAAVISNQGGYYSTFAYVSEAKRLGLHILHPCVNTSKRKWNGRGDDNSIRVGLMAIKGLSVDTINRILTCRKKNKFASSIDFWQRVQPQKDESRSLIQAGALDSLDTEKNRSRLFWELFQFRCLAKSQKSNPLFGIQLPPAPVLEPATPKELLRQEYQVLGFLCKGHPLLFYRNRLQNSTRACEFAQYIGRRVRFAGWLLSGKLVSTKTGEVMEFLTFEDETGLVETTFFPRVYRRHAPILATGRAYILQGIVEEEYGATTLTVENVKKL